MLIICRDREFAQSTVVYSSIADESISTVQVWNSIHCTHHYLCCCVSFHQSGFIFWKIKVKVDGLHSETQHRSRADWLAARVKVIHSWFRCSVQLFIVIWSLLYWKKLSRSLGSFRFPLSNRINSRPISSFRFAGKDFRVIFYWIAIDLKVVAFFVY